MTRSGTVVTMLYSNAEGYAFEPQLALIFTRPANNVDKLVYQRHAHLTLCLCGVGRLLYSHETQINQTSSYIVIRT